jgi:hypothetical protein
MRDSPASLRAMEDTIHPPDTGLKKSDIGPGKPIKII